MPAKDSEIQASHVGKASEQVLLRISLAEANEKVFYFYGWNGFGVAPVLDSAVQKLRSIKADKNAPPGLCFDRIIYIDCSAWKNTREVQRKIAEALKLDRETMSMFDKKDEQDDFSGVEQGARDAIRIVGQMIHQIMTGSRSIILFLNGSDSEVDFSRIGVPLDELFDNKMIWSFKRLSLTMHGADQKDDIAGQLRYTHVFIWAYMDYTRDDAPKFNQVMREEAASIIARNPCLEDIGLTRITDCCLYELFLHCSLQIATMFEWAAHSSNYWICDGIIKGDMTRDISDAVHQEVRWVGYDSSLLEVMSRRLMKDKDTPFLLVNDNIVERDIVVKKRPNRWISITSKNLKIQEGMLQIILEKASSLFVAFERSNNPHGLPNVLFKQSSNLSVLILSWCVFSFVSPPFLHCHGLRFLGLDNCKNDDTSEGGNYTKWAHLHVLRVLDIRYTDWDEILTEGKMDIMANLRELNIEGFYCWQYASKLQGRLPNLERLRIIKPTHQLKTSIDSSNSFVGKTKLEVLDLSGNKYMKIIPASLLMASGLQVLILDGCDGLENVVMPEGLRSSLRSFSFDDYGSAAHWTSSLKILPESSEPDHRSDADKGDAITSKISLQGCTMLENLFLRGLSNLEELDLSGSAIKILDFEAMVIDVPRLKRLILLGCEHLHAIRWGPWRTKKGPFRYEGLDLFCVDTRPTGSAPGFTRPSVAQHKPPQLHAILADPRLATRSLLHESYDDREDACFNIHITCSTEHGGDEAAIQEKVGHPCGDQRHHVLAAGRYGDDVLTGIGDALMTAFPQPPAQQSDRHIEISGGSRSLESELPDELAERIGFYARSVHLHDVSTGAGFHVITIWRFLRWCRVERCPSWDSVFPPVSRFYSLETIWASDLRKARCIQGKGGWDPKAFSNLRHLHLRSCPMLQFALPVLPSSYWSPPLPYLTTLHIIHCDRLKHVFALDEMAADDSDRRRHLFAVDKMADDDSPSYLFPDLATVHLYDLPVLQQVCEGKMSAPALETVRVRGCFALRRLPAVAARKRGAKKPAVEMEKDVWDALEWDGPAADHHPGLYEEPVHSRYYRRRHLRGTVLR